MTSLVTGGAGFIGAHLTRKLVSEDESIVVFDAAANPRRIGAIESKVKIVRGDLAVWSDVVEAVRAAKPDKIYHLGAVLSAYAEENPLGTFGVNFMGTINVLEAARLFDVESVAYTSSVASYGPGLRQPVPEESPQQPHTVYGISKVFSELWGLYYQRRHGLDFRALRFPSVVGPSRGPGGASAYTTLIIEKAALGEPYEIDVDEDARMPVLYVKDAVKALVQLMDATNARSRVYNIAGISPSATEIVGEVTKRIPDAKFRFAPRPEIVAIIDSWPDALDDSKARKEWGWRLSYPLHKLVEDFVAEVRSERSVDIN